MKTKCKLGEHINGLISKAASFAKWHNDSLSLNYVHSLSNKNYVVQTKVLRTGHILIVQYNPFPNSVKDNNQTKTA